MISNAETKPINDSFESLISRRTSKLNTWTAQDYLRVTGYVDGEGRPKNNEHYCVLALECAMYLRDAEPDILNKYFEAARSQDEDVMYDLLVERITSLDETFPFPVRALAGLGKKGIWLKFAEAIADELEYLLQTELELDPECVLEEYEDFVGLTE